MADDGPLANRYIAISAKCNPTAAADW